MICERVKEQLPEYFAGNLEGDAREKFLGHLEQCPRCRAEVEELGAVWRGLEFVPAAQPSSALRGRFQEMLEAYRFGLEQKHPLGRPTIRSWQLAAAACALLMLGVLIGRATTGGGNAQIARLETEVESMRQMVTLSLLGQQSANARLRGVSYSYQMERPDPQVENALLSAIEHDPNVNVRLSAVDALRKYVRDTPVSEKLVQAIGTQDSPLVQIALIDLLVDANDGAVIPALRKLQSADVNEAVKQRADWGLRKMGVS